MDLSGECRFLDRVLGMAAKKERVEALSLLELGLMLAGLLLGACTQRPSSACMGDVWGHLVVFPSIQGHLEAIGIM